jgi:CheY-like chemotaxis protein
MKKRILIADDDPDLRMIASDFLSSKGYDTVAVTNGMEVMEFLEKEVPDLLLLDLSMPRMNGWDAAKNIRNTPAWASLPIVAFSAHALKGDDKKALDAGCNAYVTKPINEDLLLKTIADLLTK